MAAAQLTLIPVAQIIHRAAAVAQEASDKTRSLPHNLETAGLARRHLSVDRQRLTLPAAAAAETVFAASLAEQPLPGAEETEAKREMVLRAQQTQAAAAAELDTTAVQTQRAALAALAL